MRKLIQSLGLAALLTLPSCTKDTTKYIEYKIGLENGDNARLLVFQDKKLLNILSSKGKMYFFGDCIGNDDIIDRVKIIDSTGKTTYSRSLGEHESAGTDTTFLRAQDLFDIYSRLILQYQRKSTVDII